MSTVFEDDIFGAAKRWREQWDDMVGARHPTSEEILAEQWDSMTAEQKWAEWNKESDAEGDAILGSEFHAVRGFIPRFCGGCVSHVFPTIRGRAIPTCPFCDAEFRMMA